MGFEEETRDLLLGSKSHHNMFRRDCKRHRSSS